MKPLLPLIWLFLATSVPVAGNEPPELDPIGPKSTTVGEQLSFVVTASDPDGDTLILGALNLPGGATFDDQGDGTGTFDWTPAYIQAGTYYVTFVVEDTGKLADSEVVTIDVFEKGDPGIRDTVELVISVQPDEADSQFNVELELYVFNDSTVIGATAGFFWDNPNLQLDSAKPSELTSLGFDGGTTFYRGNDIDSSNFHQQFIFGGFRIMGDGVPPVAQRQLWATYYFTLSSWSATDSIVIDSTLVPPSSYLHFSVPDTSLVPPGQIDFVPEWKGKVIVKDVSDVEVVDGLSLPQTYSLSQNYPNPFNPTTEINFEIPVRSYVTLTVYNLLGQKVKTLVDKELSPNRYVADWDGTSDDGTKVASGVYFYKLDAGDFTETKKMMFLK